MHRLLIPLILCFTISANAQHQPSLTLSYFAPYGIQLGAKAGVSLNLKKGETRLKRHPHYSLNINPQVGYFKFGSVQHNFLVNNEIVYQLTNPEKRWNPFASIGTGYLLGRQKQGGSVHLGTGEIIHEVANLHYFLPTINLGYNIAPKKNLGYFFKGFYGQKLTTQQPSSSFFGAEIGISYSLQTTQL